MFKKIIKANENLKSIYLEHLLGIQMLYQNLLERTSMLNMKIFSIQVLLNIEEL